MICKQTALLPHKNILPVVLICMLFCLQGTAQNKQSLPAQKREAAPPVQPSYYNDHDTSYYKAFERYITARFYLSQKYAGLELEHAANVSRFRYIPNTSFAMGVGVTYQSISVNIGYTFGFLNKDGEKGKTRYLDIQSHIYGRRWTIDLLGQFYKGYYLTPKGLAAKTPQSYYIRPDLRVQVMGISAYRLLNPSRFSFRSALLENEQQKKSAGSFLIGAEIYYGIIRSDSSIVPSVLSENYAQKNVRRLDFIKIGPGIGYAYTYVIKQCFYLTGSLCASLSADYTSQQGTDGKAGKFDINKGFIYRIAAGYDKDDWNVNLSLVGNQMTVSGASASDKYLLSAGNVRLTLAKRIKPGRALSQKLHRVDKVIENVKGLTPSKH